MSSQVDRIKRALDLLETVDDEIRSGDIEHGSLQEAVYCQKVVNTIVWRLNKLNNPGLEPPKGERREP